MDGIRAATADMPGILVEVTAPRAGPPTGKPVQVQLCALDPDALAGGGARRSPTMLAKRADIRDLDDGLPLPGIDWKIAGRQGGGGEIRRRRQHRRHRACSSSPTA